MDWGADSLTYTLYFGWELHRSRPAAPIMAALDRTAHLYRAADGGWSDVPEWDAVADVREYQVTGNMAALMKAKAAFNLVDSVDAGNFAAGACPSIDYQRAKGDTNHLKTLETDSNYIKAAVLLHQVTGKRSYLVKAMRKYQAVRRHFLGRGAALYTAYVVDRRGRCTQLPGQYLSSVNGNMIWAGASLARATGRHRYLTQAIATARAVGRHLDDASGVFTDPQSDRDVVEPLIEGMYLLASSDHRRFARSWLIAAASAAAADRTPAGTYGRCFNGPPPRGPVTAWQVNGGFAAMIAAAGLDPHGHPADRGYWRNAVFIRDNRVLRPGQRGDVRISFSGEAIAITGTLGERRKPGPARVLIGGKPMFNRMGIWQGEYSGRRGLAGTVLFAWRWPKAGQHRIAIAPFASKVLGSSYFQMSGYYLVRGGPAGATRAGPPS